MTITDTLNYEVISAAGVCVFTSSDLDLAKSWLADRKLSLAGARVEEVTVHTIRRTAYTPRVWRVAA